jgi:gamma-butyrobetaine dioxygenase
VSRSAADGVPEVFALFDSPMAQRPYDEAVSELEHALQCATLADIEGAPPAQVAAALLHDVGHLVAKDLVPLDQPLVDAHHERVGARWLSQWFGPEVTAPVALHVAAKRYLCAVEEGYVEELSPSSVRSLEVQGGPMRPEEVAAFESDVHHTAALRLRRWDDAGKVAGLEVGDLERWRLLLSALVGG